MSDLPTNPRYAILLKEIDQLHSTFKNLDDIIYKTKNFCIVIWGGSLLLIAQHVKVQGDIGGISKVNLLIYLTALIPVMFWAIQYRWQKSLFTCGARERMISWFINSPGFSLWLKGDEDVNFPVYDIPGRLYTKQADRSPWERLGVQVDEAYLLDHKEIGFWKILLYKDAKWFYGIMILVSILYGLILNHL